MKKITKKDIRSLVKYYNKSEVGGTRFDCPACEKMIYIHCWGADENIAEHLKLHL